MFYYDCVMFCELRLLEALFDVKAVHFTPVRLVLSALLEAELDIRTLTPSRGLELADRPGGGLGSTTGNAQFPLAFLGRFFSPEMLLRLLAALTFDIFFCLTDYLHH